MSAIFFLLFNNKFKHYPYNHKAKCIAGKPGACINWQCDEYVLVRDNLFRPYKKCRRDINRLDKQIIKLFIKKIITLENIRNLKMTNAEIKFNYEKDKRCMLIVSFYEETIEESVEMLEFLKERRDYCSKNDLVGLISESEHEILSWKLNKYSK